MFERRERWLPSVLAVVLMLGLTACGISAQSDPVDEGDAVVGGSTVTDTDMRPPPDPNSAVSNEDLVRDFLMAAAGGGASANDQVKKYLTQNALDRWRAPDQADNPPLTIVRIVGGPTTGVAVGLRTPVTVDLQVVGQMTDQGRVDELADLTQSRVTFWVVRDEQNQTNRRIDEIGGAPPGLLLSDEALTNFYRIQPVYFWDQGYTTLVPDPRYLPLTIKPDQRARRLLDWLAAGPSALLVGGVQRLPAGTTVTDNVVTRDDGKLQVKLSAQAAGGGDPNVLRRLLFELQWTLSVNGSTPRLELYIDDKLVTVPASDVEFFDQNHSYSYKGPAQRFNITQERKVVALPVGIPAAPVISAPENADVYLAAVGNDQKIAAYVRIDGAGRRYLQIVRDGAPGHVDAHVPRSDSLGRPAFVPGLPDVVLIPTGGPDGRLMAVSAKDGTYTNVTRNIAGVTSATVSPDGRRIAFVADDQAYVSSLIVANNTVTVGSNARPILAGQLAASAITWTSESWLYVAGTAGGAPAMWKVTADGVVAQNLSANMGGLEVRDLVAYPQWLVRGSGDVLALTPRGVYTFQTLFTQETSLQSPFFGS